MISLQRESFLQQSSQLPQQLMLPQVGLLQASMLEVPSRGALAAQLPQEAGTQWQQHDLLRMQPQESPQRLLEQYSQCSRSWETIQEPRRAEHSAPAVWQSHEPGPEHHSISIASLIGPPNCFGDISARVAGVHQWVVQEGWVHAPFDKLVLHLDALGVELSIQEQDDLKMVLLPTSCQ